MEMNFTRREFLKLAGLAGASTVFSNYQAEIVQALTQAITSNQVIILDGQACEGCAISLLQASNPDLYTAVKLGTSLDFLIPLSVEMGEEADSKIENFIEGTSKKPRVLVVEGSIPMAENGLFQTYWDYKENKRMPFTHMLKKTAEAADVIIAMGTAAAYGGIPRGEAQKYQLYAFGDQARKNPTGAVGVAEALKILGVDMSKKAVPAVVNLPGCPVHPDHFFLTVVDVLFGNIPELDSLGRPVAFFGKPIHDQCQFRGHFDRGEFLTSFEQYSGEPGDNFPTKPGEKGAGCFLLLGCKGPVTFDDCPVIKWNSRAEGVSWFNESGAPCEGCASPEYPDGPTKGVYVPITEAVARLPKLPARPVPPEVIKKNAAGISAGVMGVAGLSGVAYAYTGKAKKSNEKKKEG